MPNRIRSAATERGRWRDAYREFLRARTITIAWITIALFVAVMTIFGPLGTSADLRPLSRFLYWGLSAVVTFPLCYATAAVTLYVTRSRSLVEIVPAVAAAVLFEGMVCTTAVHTADTLFRPHQADSATLGAIYLTVTIVIAVCTLFFHYIVFQRIRRAGPTPAGHRSPPGADAPAGDPHLPSAADSGSEAIPGDGPAARDAPVAGDSRPPGSPGTPVTTEPPAQSTAGERAGDGAEASTGPQPTARQARFYDRLSSTVSRDIIYVTVDDHYVEVHTTGGSCLLLMNLGTAVAELGDLGMQVHRSYWVALRHLEATVRRDGRTMVRVTGDHLVPVSRTYLPALREALRTGARNRSRPR